MKKFLTIILTIVLVPVADALAGDTFNPYEQVVDKDESGGIHPYRSQIGLAYRFR